MNGEIKTIFSKVEKMEKQIQEITILADQYNRDVFDSYKINFLNYSCVKYEKLKLINIDLSRKQNILIECILDIKSIAEQEIEIALIIEGLIIEKIKTKVKTGNNLINLSQKYKTDEEKNVNIFISIEPLDSRQVLLYNCNLNLWGLKIKNNDIKYKFIELKNEYLVSFLKDRNIYYKVITKNSTGIGEVDFEFCAKGIDYSFVYDKHKDELLLYRVDLDGNLILDNLKTKETLFIDNNINIIDAVYFNEKNILIYLKNNECFLVEFKDGFCVNKCKLNYNFIIKDLFIFLNNYSQKLYVNFRLKNNKNFMIELIDENKNSGENLSAKYRIDIILYEV